MVRRRGTRGQSTLEYILVVAAVVAIILGVAYTFLKPAVETTVQDSADTISAAADKVKVGLGL